MEASPAKTNVLGRGDGTFMIDVQNIGKHYEDMNGEPFWAIRDVSFQVNEGEIVGLLGPNGAGKTTLLRILSTMLQPTNGDARLCGYSVVTEPEKVRRHIGFVSANTAVYDRMTGWEFVEYFGRLYELDDDLLQERMRTIFESFQMEDLRDRFCGKMSTGMKQKVSIARALIHDPPVLIFDEATLGLDIRAARSVLQMVSHLRDNGKCIAFSSHIMREVERLCDRVTILHGGSLVAQGTRQQLVEQFSEPDLEEIFFRLISIPLPGSTALPSESAAGARS